ncbi:MAG: hypothetical protein ABSF46_30380 [Terriglobia bacterium]
MKKRRGNCVAGRRAGFRPGAALGVFILGLVFLAALPLGAQDKKGSSKNDSDTDQEGFGIVASKRAGAKDVGLPLYPGAREHKDKSEDSPAVKFGLWGGNSGFKLAVVKLESNDGPDKVAAFYRKALKKYGKVLDCTGSSKGTVGNSDELGCEDDQPENGELVLKAGTKQDQHLVGIKTSDGLTVFQLIYIMARGSDTN